MTRPKNTKERIMRTVIDLIWTESYGSVSVDEICKKADINKGSFYHYFSSKEDLAVTAIDFHWQEVQLKMDHVFSSQKTGLTRMLDFFDLIYELQSEKFKEYGYVCGCSYTSLGSEQCVISQKIAEVIKLKFNALKKYFKAALRDADSDGEIAIEDIDRSVDEVFCYYLGVLSQARIMNDLKSIENMKQGVLGMLGVLQNRT